MASTETHEYTLPFPPAGLTRPMALAYTRVAEAKLKDWERKGLVRFRAIGPNGAKITQRSQLDDALSAEFTGTSEDMEF